MERQGDAPKLEGDAERMATELAKISVGTPDPNAKLHSGMVTNAIARIKDTYDPRLAASAAPRSFPPSEPVLVLAQAVRAKDQDGIGMVTHTCDQMAAGGIYDQLGGGFARYSVDERWLVPHFEKMLYDNAQLIHLYLDAYLVSGEKRHAAVVRDVMRYLARDMTHPDGGWYSAEDADSEGHEGKFYCWTKTELSELLSAEELALVIRHYGITEEGNFEDHSHPEPLKHQNVLSIVDPKLTDAEQTLLASARKKMDAVRAKRVRPHLDDKVLPVGTASCSAPSPVPLPCSMKRIPSGRQANYAFTQKHFWDAESKTMYHRWRDGERDSVQLLDAYAFQSTAHCTYTKPPCRPSIWNKPLLWPTA